MRTLAKLAEITLIEKLKLMRRLEKKTLRRVATKMSSRVCLVMAKALKLMNALRSDGMGLQQS